MMIICIPFSTIFHCFHLDISQQICLKCGTKNISHLDRSFASICLYHKMFLAKQMLCSRTLSDIRFAELIQCAMNKINMDCLYSRQASATAIVHGNQNRLFSHNNVLQICAAITGRFFLARSISFGIFI